MSSFLAVIPVIYSSRDDPEEKLRALKRSLQQQDSTAKGFGSSSSSSSSGQQFQPGASGSGVGNSEVSLTEGDKKWRLEATAVEEWEVRPGIFSSVCFFVLAVGVRLALVVSSASKV